MLDQKLLRIYYTKGTRNIGTMTSAAILIIKTLSLCILTASMLFNGAGVYLLHKARHYCPSQTIILMNLSITEIFIAIGYIIQDAFTLRGNNYTIYFEKTFAHVVWGLRSGFYSVWYLVMYFLAIDRFMACNLAIKHRSIATRSNIKMVLLTLWLTGMANGIILCFEFHLFYSVYTKYVWLALDGVLLLMIIVTYTTIYTRRFHMKRVSAFRNVNGVTFRSRRMRSYQQFVKVIGLIVLTFIFFEVVPTITFLVVFELMSKGTELALSFILLSYNLVILSDPLIYIFLQDRVRVTFNRQMQKLFNCCRSTVANS